MHVYLFVKQTHIVTDHKTNKYKNNLFASLRTQQEIKSHTYTVQTGMVLWTDYNFENLIILGCYVVSTGERSQTFRRIFIFRFK